MKNVFSDPELKVIQFSAYDVLTNSPDPGNNGLPIEDGEEEP